MNFYFVNLGLSCSASTGTCQCSSINYWNGSYCVALRYPGQSCSTVSQCINSSSCSSGKCQCTTNYYYSIAIGICTAQLAYDSTCWLGDYQCLNNTKCYDLTTTTSTDTCGCDSAYYYYDGTSCALYATYNQACAPSTFGPICDTQTRNLVCSGSVCTCLSTQFYNGSSCVTLRSFGFSCSSTSQCIANAFCNSSNICTCNSGYYFDTTTGVCTLKLTYLQACTATVQCSTNMYCSSSACTCITSMYYNGISCVSRPTYGETCSPSIPCNTALGLVCTSNVCQCSSTQYWSTLSNSTNICADLRTLGQTCSSESACENYATTVNCNTYCECDSSNYYFDQTSLDCESLKANGVTCAYNYECRSLFCNGTICDTAAVTSITSNVSQASSEASFQPVYINLNQFLLFYIILIFLAV